MFALIGSIVLSVLNAGVMVLLAKHIRWGWHITFCTHILLWIPYSYFTGQWGFLGLAVVHALVAVKGARDWNPNNGNKTKHEQLESRELEVEEMMW